MREIKIAPSILAADFTHLHRDIAGVLAAGADYIHVDVMDGQFVPNISIGVPVVKSIRAAFPQAFLDVHLMIEKPVRYAEIFARAGASHLTFHVEADDPGNISAALESARRCGARVGLSVKPGTQWQALEPWLGELDMVLVMTVEPGFGGQKFMADQMQKVRQLRARLDAVNPDCDVEVDGGIDRKTAPAAIAAGANVLVAGSAIFGRYGKQRIIEDMRAG